jgi:hypothetical protein
MITGFWELGHSFPRNLLFTLSRVICVTIDGVWIEYWIYWYHSELRVIYSATAVLHTLQFTTAPAKLSFPACYILTSRSLAAASNSGDSSVSCAHVFLSQTSVYNSCRAQSPETSQSHNATDGQSISDYNQIFINLWQLPSCFCGASSLKRGHVCILYMLLVLASAVLLWSETLCTRNHILLSQIWDFPFRRLLRLAGSRWRYSNSPQSYLYSPEADPTENSVQAILPLLGFDPIVP